MKQLFLLFMACCMSFSLTAQSGNTCATAQLITPNTYSVDTMYLGGAIFSNVNPYPDRGRWYKIVPATDGLMTISSCGGGADTRVVLFTGRCDSLSIFGYNDDACIYHRDSVDEYASSFSKPVKAGVTYFVHWDNAWDDSDFSFTYTLSAFVPRAGQVCSTASTATLGTTRVDSLFGYASNGNSNQANWYKITPIRNGQMTISSCGSDADTRLWVYDSICSSLRVLAGSDDDCFTASNDSLASSVSLAVRANRTYYIEWDDFGNNNSFNFVITLDVSTSTNDAILNQAITLAPNPANDNFTLLFDFEKNTNLTVKMMNMMGQIVMTQKMEQLLRGGQTFDISHLQSGMYMLHLSDGQKSIYKKLMISKN